MVVAAGPVWSLFKLQQLSVWRQPSNVPQSPPAYAPNALFTEAENEVSFLCLSVFHAVRASFHASEASWSSHCSDGG